MCCKLVRRLWNDDGGQLLTIEFLFFATIMIIGLTTGLAGVLRTALITEMTVLADAILALNPGYGISGMTGCCAYVQGSQAIVIPTQLIPPVCVPPVYPQVISYTSCW